MWVLIQYIWKESYASVDSPTHSQIKYWLPQLGSFFFHAAGNDFEWMWETQNRKISEGDTCVKYHFCGSVSTRSAAFIARGRPRQHPPTPLVHICSKNFRQIVKKSYFLCLRPPTSFRSLKCLIQTWKLKRSWIKFILNHVCSEWLQSIKKAYFLEDFVIEIFKNFVFPK